MAVESDKNTSPDSIAPDGSEVRRLQRTERGSLAQFRLKSGQVSTAVVHKTVEEIWYVLAGEGELWLGDDIEEQVIALQPGVSAVIRTGTHFQFRNAGDTDLDILGITMPPWPEKRPEEAEAQPVDGRWQPTF